MDETTVNAVKKLFDNSKKKSFASDVLTLTGGTTFAQILTILSVPILARLYQPENFGVWAIYSSIVSIISVIICMRYEYSIMLPELDDDAINLLGVSFLAIGVMTVLTLAIIWFFKEIIIDIFNSPQIGNYLWLVPPFVLVNGIFLALNSWNSRTKLFRRLSFSRISSSVSTTATQIVIGLVEKKSPTGLIVGNLTGQSVATLILAGQIWRDDRNLIRKSLNWEKMYEGLKRYSKFPLVDSFSALMNSISWQLPAFLLAAFFSPTIVGFYSLGFRLLQMPMSLIGSSISQVFFQRA